MGCVCQFKSRVECIEKPSCITSKWTPARKLERSIGYLDCFCSFYLASSFSLCLCTHISQFLSFNVRLAFPFRGEEFLEFHQENVSKSKKEKNVAQDYCSGLALASFVWVWCVRFSLRSISRTCIEMKSSDKLRWMDGWRTITAPLFFSIDHLARMLQDRHCAISKFFALCNCFLAFE